ncbi:MAG: acyl-CoA desaturase [Candidatus Pacebacteria bacterium]|nr:acyl-CoA desaturase [Candidatus Paceibacterota bacterium]
MKTETIKFSKNDPNKFFRTLNKRVNAYFKNNKIKKTGNWKLYRKAMIVFGIMFIPFIAILVFRNILPVWVVIPLLIIIGLGKALVGMNVMHDANHESFSSRKWVNKLFGASMYILSGNDYNWKVQHNVLHHTYTNIKGYDEDIDAGRIIRFSKHSKWLKIHKYQKYYAFFLYGLMTLNWAITTDFKQSYLYLKRRLSYGKFPNPATQWTKLIIGKIVYYSLWVFLPIMLGIVWWHVLVGFVIVHFAAGLTLSVIFSLAHVMPNTEMPEPNENGCMKNTWAIHQLYTTSNFSPKSKFVEFFTGGLNYQVEHHLFSHISHVHYKKISEIVRKTAAEFELPYNEYKTFWKAVKEHYNQLRVLGKKPAIV